MTDTTPDALVRRAQAVVAHLCPKARPQYLASIDQAAAAVLPKYGITNTLRLDHLLAQVIHESGALSILTESLTYRAERLMVVWPSRFPTHESAAPYERNPEKLANYVYGGRMGNTRPGDGWRYIGRGLLQITGRESYRKMGAWIGIPLEENPDLAFDARYALEVAACEWRESGCNVFADLDQVTRVSIAINGGTTGLEERKAWLAKVRQVASA